MKVIETNNWNEEDVAYYDKPGFNPYFGYVAGGFFLFTCVNFVTRALTPTNLRYLNIIIVKLL